MRRRTHRQRGQVLAEFSAMAVMVLSVLLGLILFLAFFSEYAWRLLVLIGWEPDA